MFSKGSARQLREDDFQLLTVTADVSLTEEEDLKCSYSGDIQGDEIVVQSEHAEITLRLKSNLGVSFARNPITWLAYDKPGKVETLKPECFAVARDSDQQVTIRDWNNEASHGSYRFTINVSYKGKRRVLDPTIVNKKPAMNPPPPRSQSRRAV